MVLIRWRCCYVEHVVTLNMLLSWRCCYDENVENAFKAVFMDVKSKQLHAHFSHGFLVDCDIFHQQRKLMGSSAQNSSGVHWCRHRARFNEVPEKVPKVPRRSGRLWCRARSRSTGSRRRFRRRFQEALVQSQVRFNKVSEKVLEKVGRLWCSPEKLPEKLREEVWEARARCCKAQCPVLRHDAKIQSCRSIMVVSHRPTK